MKFKTFVDVLCHRGSSQASDIAYTFLGRNEHDRETLTFAELDLIAKRKAAYLLNYAVPGDRVILAYPSGLAFITSFLGCQYAGLIAVPVYQPKAKNEWQRFSNIVMDCRAKLILSHSSYQEHMQAGVNTRPELQCIEHCLSIDHALIGFEESWKMPVIKGSTIAFLQYTSGTTGQPKGVMISHDNLLHNEAIIHKSFKHDHHSILVGWLPLFHDMGLIGNTLQGLYVGFHTIFMSPLSFLYKPARWLQMISEYRATTSGGPNFAYDLCVQRIKDEQLDNVDLSCWQNAFNGSEVVRANTVHQFKQRFQRYGFSKDAFFPCYGMAETTLFVTGCGNGKPTYTISVDATALAQQQIKIDNKATAKELVSSGGALNQKVRIVEPVNRHLCLPNQVGEIWVQGDSVSVGYWEKPIINRDIFNAHIMNSDEGPFLRTGDMGFMDGSGQLYVTGRLKEMIIIRGRNYFPQDIEVTAQDSCNVLRRNYGAAFAMDYDDQERLVLVQEVHKTHVNNLNFKKVLQQVRMALRAEQSLDLSDLVLIKQGTLPITSSGKIRRSYCKEKFVNRTLTEIKELSAIQC